ncbi:sensor histidine kinase [Amycolatopsis orientalis]|uniref:sensor histidine kinase n=1 Tax=Amycolatopsis orientalis TaxID=31958 RepID=UPI0005625820|nr:ATP-binding protein [Amycolatopsis orientalis]
MVTRARGLLDRSRVLLDRSRVAAAQFLAAPPRHAPSAPPAEPAAEQRPAVEAPDAGALAGVCSNVALRDLNLLDQLLAQLETMEAGEENSDRLAELYRLDHLATRLRRNAENLRVLAGRDADDAAAGTSSMLDVMRAAMSSIDHYSRITIGRVVSLGVVGFAAEDVSRILAELFDNAANQSSPSSPVSVSAHLTEQGSVLIRIEDEGIGMPPERLAALNERLSAGPVLDDESVRHMGLAVVGRLAHRHEIIVKLDRRTPHGTVATVLLPVPVVSELAEAQWSGTQTVVLPQTRVANGVPVGSPVATPSALPRRRPAGSPAPEPEERKPSPRPRTAVPPPADGGTTASGLPRRVSRSIRTLPDEPAPPTPSSADPADGHEALLADLDAFTDGERAALDDRHERETGGNTQ